MSLPSQAKAILTSLLFRLSKTARCVVVDQVRLTSQTSALIGSSSSITISIVSVPSFLTTSSRI